MKEITLDAVVENVREVTAFVDGEMEKLGCPLKAQMKIDVAIDEIFSNIARYAYQPGKGTATVRFEHDPEAGTVSVTFIDSGIPYDPLQKPDPDVTLAIADRAIGGLGIYLVKKTMDQVSYRYEDGRNVLRITLKTSF